MITELSEDDIRTKVLYNWLKDCGLTDNDICIEYTIPLRIGRGRKTWSSRTDILVKNVNGENLLIIEVKKAAHVLTDDDKWQAISYARSLASGGIAPFTILSNGLDSRIYDTVTAEMLTDGHVRLDHPYVVNGFRVTGNGIAASAEALEYLIGLSADNLLVFCRGQVNHYMALLKGEEIDSGRKYIPQLYVARERARTLLEQKLFGEKPEEVVLVVGPPQHGKTCFICASVDHYLKKNIPCLIYPAVGLRGSLLNAIAEDFGWAGLGSFTHAQIIQRLYKVLNRCGQQLILFIDGWNEMLADAVAINSECARLQEKKIQVVISTTSTSVPRLLKDSADNLEYIARKTKLNDNYISRLAKEPLVQDQGSSLVQIGKFTFDELRQAKKTYERAFNVKFLTRSNLPADPFYLRLAAESFQNGQVPDFATRTNLIHDSLVRKAKRRNIDEQSLFAGLGRLMRQIFEKDAPISCTDLPPAISTGENLDRWLESALLIQTENQQRLPVYDFYYTHDRDYCFALYRNWFTGLTQYDAPKRSLEINQTIRTEAGRSALRWYLSCPEYVDEIPALYDIVHEGRHTNKQLQQIIADALFNQFRFHGNKDFQWLEKHILILLSKNSNEDFPDELPELVFYYLQSINKEANPEDYKFWLRILMKSDHGIDNGGYPNSYLYRLSEEAYSFSRTGYEDDTTLDVALLRTLIADEDSEVGRRVSICLAGATPNQFLLEIPEYATQFVLSGRTDTYDVIENACVYILDVAEGRDMSGFCGDVSRYRGEDLEPGEIDEEAYKEYLEKRSLWVKVLKCIKFPEPMIKRIKRVLEELRSASGIDVALEQKEVLENETFFDPNQLKLDL
ncbi:MAG: hypothetical protein JWP94_523 [Mucilaginibacter sp.]|nr:hypothetical protein [Mucilaginibacter sp.]